MGGGRPGEGWHARPHTLRAAKRPDTATQTELGPDTESAWSDTESAGRAPMQRAAGQRTAGPRHRERRHREGESGGARHRERGTESAGARRRERRRGPGRDTESAGALRRERESAGTQHRERGGPTQRAARERRGPTQIETEASQKISTHPSHPCSNTCRLKFNSRF